MNTKHYENVDGKFSHIQVMHFTLYGYFYWLLMPKKVPNHTNAKERTEPYKKVNNPSLKLSKAIFNFSISTRVCKFLDAFSKGNCIFYLILNIKASQKQSMFAQAMSILMKIMCSNS